MEFVIKNLRIRNYLYTLGFYYREVPDRTGSQKYVWLFPNDESLQEAIKFYGDFKHKHVSYKPKI